MTFDADWAHLDVSALGATIRVTHLPSDPRERARVVSPWSGARAEDSCDRRAQPQSVVEYRDSDDQAVSALVLTVSVTLAALDAAKGTQLMFHAGGVARSDGSVIALVGPSGMGKTTATRELCASFGYVSDETVGVDADGRVFAYRKPLSILEPTSHVKVQASPSELGLRNLPEHDLHLGGIVLLQRRTSTDQSASMTGVDAVTAVVELLPQISYLGELVLPIQRLLHVIDLVGGVKRVEYSDASQLTPLVAGLTTTPQQREWAPVRPYARAVASSNVALADIQDAVAIDGKILAFARETLYVLDGIAPTIWKSLCAGADLSEICSAVVAAHGAPPHGTVENRVSEALAALREQGLVNLNGVD